MTLLPKQLSSPGNRFGSFGGHSLSVNPPVKPLLLTNTEDADGANAQGSRASVGSWRTTIEWANPMTKYTGGIGRNREGSTGQSRGNGVAFGGVKKNINLSGFLARARAQQSNAESGELPSGLGKRRRSPIGWWAKNPLADELEEGKIRDGGSEEGAFPLTLVAGKAEQHVIQDEVSRLHGSFAWLDRELTDYAASKARAVQVINTLGRPRKLRHFVCAYNLEVCASNRLATLKCDSAPG